MRGPHGVPAHQMLDKFMKKNSRMKKQVETKLWVEGVRKGVETIIGSGRVTSETSIADLRKCIAFLEARESTPFQWDTSLYTAPKEQNERKVSSVIESEDASVNLEEHNQLAADEDEQQLPDLTYRMFYLIKLEAPPFWGIARYFFVFLHCGTCLFLFFVFFS
jgi:hypothetical protein